MIKQSEEVVNRLIHHKTFWAGDAGDTVIRSDDALVALVEFHKHMTRWRTMGETPEIGERIEIAYQCKADWIGNWSAVDTFDGEFERFEDDNDMIGHPYAWRPVSDLPEVSDAA